MKSILVIGLGRFGKNLALKLSELGNDVMVVDKDDELVEQYAPMFTDAQIGDCRNEAVVRSLGVRNFDVCFVAIGDDFQASLEITSLLKELGAKHVVSKATRDRQAKFLLRIGADEVVDSEKEISEKLAVRYNAKNIFDYIRLTPEYSIFEIPIPADWVGRSIADIDVRNKHRVNIIAVKQNNILNIMPGAAYKFDRDDHIVIIGKPGDATRLSSRT